MSDWIEWNGCKCQVIDDAMIDYRLRGGTVYTNKANCIICDHLGTQCDVVAFRIHNQDAVTSEQPKPKQKQNKYSKQVNGASIDVYDVLMAWNVTNPAVQHAIKKLLQPGNRGHKDKLTDLSEARDSIIRAIELESK